MNTAVHEGSGAGGPARNPAAGGEQGRAVGIRVMHDRVPGRTRFHVDGLFRNPGLAERLTRTLRSAPGVLEVRASPRTGRLLVRHGAGLSGGALRTMVAQAAGRARGRDHREETGAGRQAAAQAATGSGAHPRTGRGQGHAGAGRRAGGGSARHAAPDRSADDAGTEPSATWHATEIDAALERLGVDAGQGLSGSEAASRLSSYGRNELAAGPARNELVLFAEQFVSLPVAMLGGSAAFSLATRAVLDAAVTAGVVLANAVIGWATESGSARLISRITEADATEATVRRDGREHRVRAEEVVPGDILVLRPGDPVVADARLLHAHQLSVNESSLTGESVPVRKRAEQALPARTALGDRHNMLYMGTAVAGGSATALVVATGNSTEIGRIQDLAGATRAPATPTERDLDSLGRDLALGALGVCGAAFLLGVIRGHPWLGVLRGAVALAVAAVPEGLPTVATSTLALGLQRMRRQQLLVRRLGAVEALGSVQTLCLDKTGTLTCNRMRVTGAVVDGRSWQIRDASAFETDAAEAVEVGDVPALVRLARMAALASEVDYRDDLSTLPVDISSTERALHEFASEAGVAATDSIRVETRFRDDSHNYVGVRYESDGDGITVVKGRPGEVLAMCSAIERDGEVEPMSDALRQQVDDQNAALAARGLRVLGVACALESRSVHEGLEDLVWIGLAGMSDPVRPGVAEVIGRFQQAGVRTVMITGDQAPTAQVVAEQLRLAADETLSILDAEQLDSMDPEVLTALAGRTHVFARVSPAKKLEIVQALQRAGQVVAMTGDGINDGPALKAADVGVALGREGTRVARDVADVVIADDDLEHLVAGIAEGRTIVSNIRKSVHFLLATNFSEILVVFAELLMGPRDLESPMELFWINLVTDVFPSLGLALEPQEANVLDMPPRGTDEPLIGQDYYRVLWAESAIIAASALSVHLFSRLRYGAGEKTRSLTFLTLVSAQLLHALSCRSDRFRHLSVRGPLGNPALTASLAGSFALQALPFLWPPLRRLLGIGPLRPGEVAIAAVASGASFAANELLLLTRDRRARRGGRRRGARRGKAVRGKAAHGRRPDHRGD